MRDAEKNIIGALLTSPDRLSEIYKTVTPEMFSDDLYGRMYAEIRLGFEKGEPVDGVVLKEHLAGEHFPGRNIPDEILACIKGEGMGFRIQTYGKLVRDGYKARRLGEILNNTRPDATHIDAQIRDTVAAMEALLTEERGSKKTVAQLAEEFEGKYFVPDETPRIRMGFRELDDTLGGLEGGDVIVIGARPKVGKSAFALQIIRNFADAGKKVGYFNLEMKEKQIFERMEASASGLAMNRIRFGTDFKNDEESKYRKGIEELKKRDNVVVFSGTKRVSDIRADMSGEDFDVIVIDYLQLIIPDGKRGSNRFAEVGDISRATKAIAMDFNIPVVELTQLNRASEMKSDREPTMAEIRESGDVEQDASVILLLWNPDKNDPTRKMLKVEASRQSRTMRQELTFDGRYMRFVDAHEFVSVEDSPFT